MAYTPDYTEADLEEASINTIAKAIISVGGFIVIIVLIFLFAWVRKKRVVK